MISSSINSYMFCQWESFWLKHNSEPLFYDDSLELEYQALDMPTLLTWRNYI